MSSQSNAIKCFTYDWLIRFFELHPVDKKSFPGFSGGMQLHGFETKLAAISPLFNRIANAYIPRVYNYNAINIQKVDNPFGDCEPIKTVHTILHLKMEKLSNNFITREFIDKRTHFVTSSLNICDTETLTPYELKYLLPGCYGVHLTNITLSETLNFSEVWPLLRHCSILRLKHVKKLIFDSDVTNIMIKQPPVVPIKVWEFDDLNIFSNQIVNMLETFLCYASDDSALALSFSEREKMDKETEITVSKMLMWLRANKFNLRAAMPESPYFQFESNIVVRKLGPKKVAVLSTNRNVYGYRRNFF